MFEDSPGQDAHSDEAPLYLRQTERVVTPGAPGADQSSQKTHLAPGTSLLGTIVGSIRIVEILGKGGMGEVYAGFDEKLKRKVALKALRGEIRLQAQARGRFIHEAHVLSQLEHPHICRIYDLIEGENQDFLVLELIQGTSLTRAINSDLARVERFRIARQIAEVLSVTHDKGIVHRDLKPDNVMLTPEKEVKVLDFGLSKFLMDPKALTIMAETTVEDANLPDDSLPGPETGQSYAATHAGSVIGTIGYMSPEQARGEAATPASDMFCFGLLLQQLFSGEPPFQPRGPVRETLSQASRGETRPFIDPDKDLVALVNRLKSLAPAARPPAVDVVERLDWIAQKPRRRVVRTIGTAAVASLLVATTLAVLMAHRAHVEAETAAREAATARQVADFMVRMFAVSDPDIARGRTITAREILDQGVRRVRTELRDQPQVQARMMSTMGDVYSALGLYEEAEPLLRQALEQKSARSGDDSAETAETCRSLGVLLWRKNDLSSAAAMLDRAIRIHERILGPEHPEVAKDLSAMAAVRLEQGKYQEARALCERALRIDEQALGREDPMVATDLDNLASVLHRQGDLKQAEPLYRQALSIRKKVHGTDHPDMAQSLNNLATLYQEQGEISEARALSEQALRIDEKVFGPEHPIVAVALSNLAYLIAEQGRYPEAKPLYERALGIAERTLGPWHPQVATILTNLASLKLNLGDTPGAKAMFERALRIDEQAFGADHPDVAVDLNNLATVLSRQGDFAAAQVLLERVRRIYETVLGPEHPDLATTLNNMATNLYAQGKYAEARPLLERVLQIDERALGEWDPLVAGDLFKLADTDARLGNQSSALRLAERAVKISEKQFREAPGDETTAIRYGRALLNSGCIQSGAGNLEVAKANWTKAVDVVGSYSATGANIRALDVSARSLLLLGRRSDARPLAQRLLAEGWDNPDFLDLCRKNGLLPAGGKR